jgi:hypothetical protein
MLDFCFTNVFTRTGRVGCGIAEALPELESLTTYHDVSAWGKACGPYGVYKKPHTSKKSEEYIDAVYKWLTVGMKDSVKVVVLLTSVPLPVPRLGVSKKW